MKWNYRIVQIEQGGGGSDPFFKIMECFYNEDGSVAGLADACLGDEYPGRLESVLTMMLDDIKRNPSVLQPEDAVGFKNNPETHTPF